MKKNVMKSQKGFSLIELMVVVAIIGILASIAIPNFKRFQIKSKQSTGKALLADYYVKAAAFKLEYGVYAGNFVAHGFKPTGELTYRLDALDNGFVPPAPALNDAACITTSKFDCAGTYNGAWSHQYTAQDATGTTAPAT